MGYECNIIGASETEFTPKILAGKGFRVRMLNLIFQNPPFQGVICITPFRMPESSVMKRLLKSSASQTIVYPIKNPTDSR